MKCPYCPKKFSRSQGLGIHKSRIHGIKGKRSKVLGVPVDAGSNDAEETEDKRRRNLQYSLHQEKKHLTLRLSMVDALIED
jgi:uncharacterized Zn-finger protein